MLDLRRLRLLRELDARGTVHGAARALDYTPSAISQQLAVLEREAGVALLERSGRNVRLTDGRAGAGPARRRRCWTGWRRPRPSSPASPRGRVAGLGPGRGLPVRVPADRRPRRRRAGRHPSRRPRRGGRDRGRGGGARAAAAAARRGRRRRVRRDSRAPSTPTSRASRCCASRSGSCCPRTTRGARRERVPMRRLAGAAWAGCQPGTGHREMQVRVCRELRRLRARPAPRAPTTS